MKTKNKFFSLVIIVILSVSFAVGSLLHQPEIVYAEGEPDRQESILESNYPSEGLNMLSGVETVLSEYNENYYQKISSQIRGEFSYLETMVPNYMEYYYNRIQEQNREEALEQAKKKEEKETLETTVKIINSVTKSLPDLVNSIKKDVKDGGDFDWDGTIESVLNMASDVASSCGPKGQIVGAALGVYVAAMKIIIGGSEPSSELSVLKDEMRQQFAIVNENLAKTNEAILELSTKIDDSTNKIVKAIEAAGERTEARHNLVTFMSSTEGNFSYSAYKNYVYGTQKDNSNANTAYASLLRNAKEREDEALIAIYYDALFNAIYKNMDVYKDYVMGAFGGKSIVRSYYDVLRYDKSLIEEGETAESQTIKFAADLINTEMDASKLLLSCLPYQQYQMLKGGKEVYVFGNPSTDFTTLRAIENNELAEQLLTRMDEIVDQIGEDVAYVLNLRNFYVVESSYPDGSENIYEIYNRNDSTFGNVVEGQTIYLYSIPNSVCDCLGLNKYDYKYEISGAVGEQPYAESGIFSVNSATNVTARLLYKGKEISRIVFRTSVSDFNGGSGTKYDPYRISNYAQFLRINEDLEAHYCLIKDVDFSAFNYNEYSILPFGFKYVNGASLYDEFSGSIKGNGFTVKNLTISSSLQYSGIFAKLSGSVSGLNLENVKINTNVGNLGSNLTVYGGIIAGVNSGTITDCHIYSNGETYQEDEESLAILNSLSSDYNRYVGSLAAASATSVISLGATAPFIVKYSILVDYYDDYKDLKSNLAGRDIYRNGISVNVTNNNTNRTYDVRVGGFCGENRGTISKCSIDKNRVYAKSTHSSGGDKLENNKTGVYCGGISAVNIKNGQIKGVIEDCIVGDVKMLNIAKHNFDIGTFINNVAPHITALTGGIVGVMEEGSSIKRVNSSADIVITTAVVHNDANVWNCSGKNINCSNDLYVPSTTQEKINAMEANVGAISQSGQGVKHDVVCTLDKTEFKAGSSSSIYSWYSDSDGNAQKIINTSVTVDGRTIPYFDPQTAQSEYYKVYEYGFNAENFSFSEEMLIDIKLLYEIRLQNSIKYTVKEYKGICIGKNYVLYAEKKNDGEFTLLYSVEGLSSEYKRSGSGAFAMEGLTLLYEYAVGGKHTDEINLDYKSQEHISLSHSTIPTELGTYPAWIKMANVIDGVTIEFKFDVTIVCDHPNNTIKSTQFAELANYNDTEKTFDVLTYNADTNERTKSTTAKIIYEYNEENGGSYVLKTYDENTGEYSDNLTIWDDYYMPQAASCTKVGWRAFVCLTCGRLRRYYTSALGHEYVYSLNTPSTCYMHGEYGEIKCGRDECDAKIENAVEMPLLPHSYISYEELLEKYPNAQLDSVYTLSATAYNDYHFCVHEIKDNRIGDGDPSHVPYEAHQFDVKEKVGYVENEDGVMVAKLYYVYTCVTCGFVREFEDENAIVNDNSPILVVSDGYVLKGGDEVTIYVQLVNNSKEITGANFGVRFSDGLKLINYEYGNLVKSISTNDNYVLVSADQPVENGINFAWASAEIMPNGNAATNGNLLKLVFRVDEQGKLPTVDGGKVSDLGDRFTVSVIYNCEDNFTNGCFLDEDNNKLRFATKEGTIRIVDHLPGDANDDGEVDLNDVVAIGRYLVLPQADRPQYEEENPNFIKYANVNLEGGVEINDMREVLLSIVGGYCNVMSPNYLLSVNMNGYGANYDKVVTCNEDTYSVLDLLYLDEDGNPVQERQGYKFLGWFDKPVGGNEINVNSTISYNNAQYKQTIYAQWDLNQIKFEGEGATNDTSMATISYVEGVSTYSLPPFTFERKSNTVKMYVPHVDSDSLSTVENYYRGIIVCDFDNWIDEVGNTIDIYEYISRLAGKDGLGTVTVKTSWKSPKYVFNYSIIGGESDNNQYEFSFGTLEEEGRHTGEIELNGYTSICEIYGYNEYEDGKYNGRYRYELNDIENRIKRFDTLDRDESINLFEKTTYCLFVHFDPIVYSLELDICGADLRNETYQLNGQERIGNVSIENPFKIEFTKGGNVQNNVTASDMLSLEQCTLLGWMDNKNNELFGIDYYDVDKRAFYISNVEVGEKVTLYACWQSKLAFEYDEVKHYYKVTGLNDYDLSAEEGGTSGYLGIPSRVYTQEYRLLSVVGEIAAGVFTENVQIERLYIPNTIKSIGAGAFSGCKSLSTIEGIPFVGANKDLAEACAESCLGYIFGETPYDGGTPTTQYYAKNASKTYYIPSSLKTVIVTGGTVYQGAFSNCSGLTEIKLADLKDSNRCVDSIYECAFTGCDKLYPIPIPKGLTTDKITSHSFDKCVCTICGKVDHSEAIANNGFCRHDDYVYLGSYPQGMLDSGTKIELELIKSAGDLPTAEDSQGWTSYDYYIEGSNETDYMWYIDLSLGGENYLGNTQRYRGVYFTEYRPFLSTNVCTETNGYNEGYQYANGYRTYKVYWFRYEPVKWRILYNADGYQYVISDLVLDGQFFYKDEKVRTTDGTTIYPNNYAESSIRDWLNNDFYNTTFNETEKQFILLTDVDNSSISTNPYGQELWTNVFASNNTQDYVFLPSESEITNPEYGYLMDYTAEDTHRLRYVSQYAASQGAVQSTSLTSWWFLRSPVNNYGNSWIMGVDSKGMSSHTTYAYDSGNGIVPAMLIDICFAGHTLSDDCICTICGKVQHSVDDDCVCTVCGSIDHSYALSQNGFCRHRESDNDYVYIGSYPQSQVVDDALISRLNDKSNSLPSEINSQNWTSYEYYISGSVSNYMWYIDLEYSGVKYRGVYFTSYRPYYMSGNSTSNTYQDDNGYNTSTVYWFKYEPIKWRILSESDGEALILCEMIIDSQEYYPSDSTLQFSHNGGTGYANNYSLSNIRKWLNDTFYNTAFSALQKELILKTTVDNSVRSTNPNNNATAFNNGNNPYACADTDDYIFLLSEQEVTNSSYGFNSSYSVKDSARQKRNTDYAKSQGCWTSTSSDYVGNGYWWLRSSYYGYANYARYVYYSGFANYHGVYYTGRGVVPALNLVFCSGGHTLNEDCQCTKCGKTLHSFDADCQCTECGTIAHLLNSDCLCIRCGGTHHGIKDGAYCRHDNYVYFGTYPQTEVTDSTITAALNSAAGSLPTASDSQMWTSYNYYYSNNNTTDYMWYIDIEYNNEYYRGVYFTKYRPSYTDRDIFTSFYYQEGNGYKKSTVYWFKYEPIKWRILDEANGDALLLSELIIDSQDYYNSTTNRTIDGVTTYPNNYQYSSIRNWLNDTFYETAFSSLQKQLISITKVDNGARSTNSYADGSLPNGQNTNVCANTNDRIFLLSEQEVTDPAYGFSNDYNTYDKVRQKTTTEYANSQNAWVSTNSDYLGNGWWWLRSPYGGSQSQAFGIRSYGSAEKAYDINRTDGGIVPALRINFCLNGHDFINCICTVCGTVKHNVDENCVCRLCGVIAHGVRDGESCRHEDHIYFGSYPQVEVDDAELKVRLNSKTGTLPTSSNSQSWTSFEYYQDNAPSDYMWYKDVFYNGEWYRGIYFSNYRPWNVPSTNDNNLEQTYQDDNGYAINNVYWFKYTPIKWNLLSQDGSEVLLFADLILDSQPYDEKKTEDYRNKYISSTIREWLNCDFYSTAFNMLQKRCILDTTVDNSARSTNPDSNATLWNSGNNDYASSNTLDKIFLLSEQEITSSEYGFNSIYDSVDDARKRIPSAYAKANGAYVYESGYGYYWLRSPDYSKNTHTRYVYDGGKTNDTYWVDNTPFGIVPAMWINLCINGHKLNGGCVCTVCGTVQHSVDDDCVCTVCGETAHGVRYGGYCRHDEYVYFGTYPQTEVTDSTITTALSTKAGTLPTAEDSQKWTSYNYYIEGSNTTDFMWYIDIEYNCDIYRGVYFASYRPYYTTYSSEIGNSIQKTNGYNISTAYWFKYTPIKWRILSESNNEALIFAEMIIDSQEYYPSDSYSSFSHNGGTGYVNNYALSNIRKWLNENFYNTAFNDLQKELIIKTTVDNSASSTNPDKNPTAFNNGNNSYVCDDTEDFVFLLSEQEVTNSSYGFSSDYSVYDIARQKKSTDYAMAQGCYTSSLIEYKEDGYWWLRSPYYNSNSFARSIYDVGYADYYDFVYGAASGIVPALRISICSGGHSFDDDCRCTKCGRVIHTLDSDCTCTKCCRTMHNLNADCLCIRCGGTYHGIKDGAYCRHDNYVYFGTYPQTVVTDSTITAALNTEAGTLPNSSYSRKWTSYKYYIEENNSTDYMWYIDIEYKGVTYRGVYFTSYRPKETSSSSSTDDSYQDDYGYNKFTVYWFKYEPIKWRILTQSNGSALILCEMSIDAQEYCTVGSIMKYSHNGGTGFANDYALSNIRKWLNNNFYNTAFNELEKGLIVKSGGDPNDNIFLLSEQEASNGSYGFDSDSSYQDAARQKTYTDYAKAQGGYENSHWWLKAPSVSSMAHLSGESILSNLVFKNGVISRFGAVSMISGVVPALRIKLY